jgi:hypothetical protein
LAFLRVKQISIFLFIITNFVVFHNGPLAHGGVNVVGGLEIVVGRDSFVAKALDYFLEPISPHEDVGHGARLDVDFLSE